MKIDDITVCYGTQTVLSHFSLCLPQSGVVALMGPSGVGKTTLLRVLMGLETPQSGTVERPETPAYLFQEDRLLPWLTALGNVEAVLPKGAKTQAAEALRAMGLPAEAFAKRPEALSGGMRRRVALARMVCFGGDVWLMDEAFKGLDTDSKHQVMDALVRYAEGRLIVMVTHDEQDARYMDAHIIRLTGPPLTVQRA
ncbi:MAG: ABC transporter ATP-binding protein [Clostridiales bacterium]|nr:ABC transporter ATP-binding protein [Clostridiales bacterium]